jgi:hypothetical protein
MLLEAKYGRTETNKLKLGVCHTQGLDSSGSAKKWIVFSRTVGAHSRAGDSRVTLETEFTVSRPFAHDGTIDNHLRETRRRTLGPEHPDTLHAMEQLLLPPATKSNTPKRKLSFAKQFTRRASPPTRCARGRVVELRPLRSRRWTSQRRLRLPS